MSNEQARQLLELASDATTADVSLAFAKKSRDIEARIASAPTAALQEKFRLQKQALAEALQLLSDTDLLTDLPAIRPSSSAPQSAASGENPIADGRYILSEKLAEIPSGALFRAQEAASGNAVTLCLAPAGQSAEWRQSFRLRAFSSRERLAPNAGGVIEVSADETFRPYFIIKPLFGRTLRSELDEVRRVRGSLPVDQAVKATAALARMLGAANPGFVHGDIRPETAWLCPDGSLRLLGFSDSSRDLLPTEDQMGLACLLWEMLTGRSPSALRENLTSLRPDVPSETARVLEKAMQHDPKDRYRDLDAFAAALLRKTRAGHSSLRFGVSQFALAFAVILIVGGLAYTYPEWKAFTPWESAEEKQQAISLASFVHQLKAQDDAISADLRKQDADSTTTLNTLADKYDNLPAGTYSNLIPRYFRALLDHADKQTQLARYSAGTNAPLDAQLAQADSLITAGDFAAATSLLHTLEQSYRTQADLRRTVDESIIRDHMAAAQALAGSWSDGACGASASQWAIKDGMLHVNWPAHGEFVERLLGAQDGAVYTEGVSQNDAPGQLMRYTPIGNLLTIDTYGEQHMQMRFKRC